MTLSPEARAAAVVRDYYATDLDVINGAEGEKRTIEALIAKAIREAENDALERARLIASAMIPGHFPANEFERAASNTACAISIEIERIKHRHKD